MQLWNWLCKYHFSSDIRNFISHIKYYTQMFFSAYAFKGQVHVFSGQVKIVSHMSCRTSAILSYFCLRWFLCIVVHTVFIPAQNLKSYHECESGRKKSVQAIQEYSQQFFSYMCVGKGIDVNHSDFCGSFPFFKADFLIRFRTSKFRKITILQAKWYQIK